MRDRVLFIGIGIVAVLALSSSGFSQVQAAQTRTPQQIVINGQLANGAYVTTAGGQIQTYTCSQPQHYTTADGSSQGWACYEQTSGVWLLNAQPPAQAQVPAPAPIPQPVPQQPTIVYQQPQPVVVYQQAPPPVIYQPAPTVIYQQPAAVIYQQPAPTIVYAPAPRPVIVRPVYPSSVVLGTAATNAAGRIASAAIRNSHHSRDDYYDRDRYYDRGRGRRW